MAERAARTANPAAAEHLTSDRLLDDARADVAASRERARQRRLSRLALGLWVLAIWLGWRVLQGDPVQPGLPALSPEYGPALIIVGLLAVVLLFPLVGAGKSPHVLYRPNEIPVSLDDVKGAGVVREEVVRTLNLFLAHRTFRDELGGNPRRAVLFEGPPGTGKTHMAKAMSREAGVPFLFVSSSAFQSMYYGQTNRKIRNYFRALRKAARREGGAIGFIEEIDAIGATRAGMGGGGGREGIAGVVNELLIQLQSFDEPPAGARVAAWLVDQLNRFLPHGGQLRRPRVAAANVLVVGATNRAADLDPALLRPGRFDRVITFGLPNRAERRELIDYYLDKKAHVADLDLADRREALAASTFGYSPVMIEHLFDESLVWALRRGGTAFDWADVQQARLTEELGLRQPVVYAERERRLIATHEAGHATVAWLVGQNGPDGRPGFLRQLDVLSIIKRRDALGLLAHSDTEERYLRSQSELEALLRIALGGLVAEELFFGETSTGPGGDLTGATQLAAEMVGGYGMAGSLVSFLAADMAGAGNLTAKVLADEDSRAAVERILEQARAEVRVLLRAHREVVEALRDALLDRDELLGEEIEAVIATVRPDGVVVDVRELTEGRA